MTQLPKNPTLKDMQEHIKKLAIKRGWNKNNHLEIFLLLTEEIGELAKAVRNKTNLYTENNKKYHKEELELEFADVMNYIFDLANYFDINLEEAFRKKDKINAERNWKN
ncbi:MAG: RS21-C6 protein [Chlorobi bacterium]|nr:RS21-C6 protein [Chlorobiota bacterium]